MDFLSEIRARNMWFNLGNTFLVKGIEDKTQIRKYAIVKTHYKFNCFYVMEKNKKVIASKISFNEWLRLSPTIFKIALYWLSVRLLG